MNNVRTNAALVLSLLLLNSPVFGQVKPPTQPPGRMYSPDNPKVTSPTPILRVTKIVPKLGMAPQVQRLETERVAALKKAGWPRLRMTIESVTGVKQFWVLTPTKNVVEIDEDIAFINGRPELKKEIERIDAAQGPLLEARIELTLLYQPAISYRPKLDWTKVKAWDMIWIQLQQGRRKEYVENRVMTREEHDAGAFDTHQLMHAMQSGQRSGMFFMMRPMVSLATMDELRAADFAEPLSEYEGKWKTQLHRMSTETEEEAYWNVILEATIFPN